MKARVDHLHAGVPQGARNDLCATVVPVQSGLGHDDPDFSGGLGRHYWVYRLLDRELTVMEQEVSTVSNEGTRYENE
jgi:hypothetical protein